MAGSDVTGRSGVGSVDEPSVREVLAVLSRRRRAVATFALAVVVVALACSLLQASVYTAEARVLIEQRASQQVINGSNQPVVVDRKRVIDTEVRIIDSEEVRGRIEAQFGPGTPEPTVTAIEGTDLVAITVASTDPALAAAVANATATAYIDYRLQRTQTDLLGAATILQGQIEELEEQIRDLDATSRSTQGAEQSAAILAQAAANTRYSALKQQADALRLQASVSGRNATLVDPADVPDDRSSPTPIRSGVLALIVGAIFGAVLAYVVEFFDDRLESQAALEQLLPDLPVLGIVPVYESWPDRGSTHIAALEEPDGAVAEAYRSLRVALQFVDSDRRYQVLQVTSSTQGEGKSATAVNLAVMYSLAGQSVLLVDADLRRPRLHRFLGTPNGIGLSTALLKGAPLDEVVQDVAGSTIRFVPAGPTPSFPTELLQSRAADAFFSACREAADVVIVDSAPVLPVADPLALSSHADAVVLVVSAQRSQRRNVTRAAALLGTVAANVSGIVLNEASASASGADRYADYKAEDVTTRRRVEKLFRPDDAA